MKFIISSTALLAALKKIGKTDANPLVSILEDYLFVLTGEELKICVSDLSNTFTTTAFVENTGKKDGSFCIECKKLWNILLNIEEQPIVIEVNDIRVSILGDSFVINMDCDSPLDYPKVVELHPAHHTLQISESEFFDIISSLLPFSSNDDLRPAMKGIYLKVSGNDMEFVATDGHRLVKCNTLSDKKNEEDFHFIMERKTLRKLLGTLSRKSYRTVVIKVEKHSHRMCVQLISGNDVQTTLMARLTDEKFPDYNSAIPNENTFTIRWQVDRRSALSAFRRAKLFSNRATNQVRLSMCVDYVKVSSEDLDFSHEYNEKIPSKVLATDYVPMLPFVIGFNGRFLVEIASNIKASEIQMACSAPNRAAVVRAVGDDGQRFMYLVMPVMLNYN